MRPTPYDEIADWYAEWVGANLLPDDPYFPTVEALMGGVGGQRICDLACGQGRVARHLAARGARVIAVDSSSRLLEIARERERREQRGIDYRQIDARTLDGLGDAWFDGVLCFQALMDIPELGSTVRSVARVLRPGGWFVFSVLHPCYHTSRSDETLSADGWTRLVGSYFREGHWQSDHRTGPPGKVGAYHRTLSTYLNTLTGAGFILEHVSEPSATPKVLASRPIWGEVPAVLAVRCRRSNADPGVRAAR
ncbi:MAG: class I SAM-dependent methyltransferase [Chloroflexota bacterium]|nr:class I SAM-dependent methyltransferase [Chloroflexota bacterium]